jgi:LPS sulfotransferase NodH
MIDSEPIRRFMLLSTARTGSNLLSSLLSSNPCIRMYGELFNLATLPRAYLGEALDDPVAYLRKRLYGSHRREISAVGFKMFYDHLKGDYFQSLTERPDASEQVRNTATKCMGHIEDNYEWSSLFRRFRETWDVLIKDQELVLIHLRRKNMLHTLISLKTAFMTGQFWCLRDGGQTKTMVYLDPEECRRYFQKVDACAGEADIVFARHRRVDVSYEDMVEDRQRELTRICEYLKVPYRPLSTRMKKQIVTPAWGVVENYTELKSCFRHTKWSAFFE